MLKTAVLTISDRASKGVYEDTSGKKVIEMLKTIADVVAYEVIPDDLGLIKEKLAFLSDALRVDVVVTTGGTGIGARDVTPEAMQAVIEKELPGMAELMRAKSLEKTDRAVLSRAKAGIRRKTLIINLPGSEKAAAENLGFIIGTIQHAVDMINGKGH